MNSAESGKRAYVSPLRAAQARETRWTVLRAAGRLFAERGYAGTSISDIAAAAGVGRATVAVAVGTKPELLKQAYDTAIAGDDDPTPMPERALAFRQARDQVELLDGYAAHATAVGRRSAGIAEAVRGAAGADPDARALYEATLRQRRIGAGLLVAHLLTLGPLRDGLDEDTAADVVWLLIDPSQYHALVHGRGWSEEKFERWFAATLRTHLLGISAEA